MKSLPVELAGAFIIVKAQKAETGKQTLFGPQKRITKEHFPPHVLLVQGANVWTG